MPEELDDYVPRGLEEYWAIVRRRRWWILLPLFSCWIVVWGFSWLLPTTYRSEALIFVEQQKVPDHYVVPNITFDARSRLQSMTQQILSRAHMQSTIDHFHLYSQGRGLNRLLNSGDPVEQMRKDIKIELVDSPEHPGELTSFKIQYSSSSPILAQQVNSELTSLFVNENVKAQQQQSENTTVFLDTQLEEARAKLAEQEVKVRAFKAKHLGDLPNQLESNVQILSGLQAQLQAAQRSLDGARQQKIYLESLQQQYQSAQTSLSTGNSPTSREALAKELVDLRVRLSDLRSRYTDDHPDIVAVKGKISKTETLMKQLADEIASTQKTENASSAVDHAAVGEVQRDSLPSMMQIQSQLKANQLEIQNYQQHERDLETQVSAYQARLNVTPEIEQELAEVSRGYEESKSNYNSLLQKQMQSQLATSLERQQNGEQFSIVDPPNLPDRPLSPSHFLLSLGGLVLGTILGVALTALLEMTDVRIRQEKDLERLVPARVLVGIPRLSTPTEDHLRLTAQWIELGAVATIIILIVVGNLFAFYKA